VIFLSGDGDSPGMSATSNTGSSDLWSNWLIHDRHGQDADLERLVRAEVAGVVDRVLDAARLAPGARLADIGAGDGAVAYRAIERVGESLDVLLCDVSVPLLERARAVAVRRGVLDQCTFLHASADHLEAIADGSIDVVTTRAVLAYVADKRAALREFHRILKPGGRLSMAEPLLQEEALLTIAIKRMLDTQGGEIDRLLSLVHRWKSAQFPDTLEKLQVSPICNYSEHDLQALVQESGFLEVDMELHVDKREHAGVPWSVFVAISPHPLAPTLSAILKDRFTPEEALLLERALRPSVEAACSPMISRNIYLNASKPAV
jgi:ubiquinone/menaquinone biosynthesis C-methylase UbiE